MRGYAFIMIDIKRRPFIAAALLLAAILLAGCSKNYYEEGSKHEASVIQFIENKAIACLGPKNEKPEEIWTVYYDDERNMFTIASESVCIIRHGNIIHGACETYFPMIEKKQADINEDFGTTKTIEYNIERMDIVLDFDTYRRAATRDPGKSTVVSFDRLREP
jgi:hypothetical protein